VIVPQPVAAVRLNELLGGGSLASARIGVALERGNPASRAFGELIGVPIVWAAYVKLELAGIGSVPKLATEAADLDKTQQLLNVGRFACDQVEHLTSIRLLAHATRAVELTYPIARATLRGLYRCATCNEDCTPNYKESHKPPNA
jgi:hypothetical protein